MVVSPLVVVVSWWLSCSDLGVVIRLELESVFCEVGELSSPKLWYGIWPLVNGVTAYAEGFCKLGNPPKEVDSILFAHMNLLATLLDGKISILFRQVKLTNPRGKLSYHERNE